MDSWSVQKLIIVNRYLYIMSEESIDGAIN
jgi:hypothetical protein